MSRLRQPSSTGAVQVVAAQVPGITGLLGLAIGVVIIAGLYFAQDVLIPITLAILLSFVLMPVVTLLRRMHVPKAVAVLLTVLSALGMLAATAALVGVQVAELADEAPAYARTIEAKIERAAGFATERLAFLDRSEPAPVASPRPGGPADQIVSERGREPVPVRVTDRPQTTLELAGEWLMPVLSPLSTFAIVLVVAIFILMQKEDLRDRMIRLFGSSDLHRTTTAMDDAGARLSRYFLSLLAVNTGYGVIVTIGLWLIGLPVPALWGILAAVLRFVPYVGSILGSLLPLIVAAGVDPGWTMVVSVAILFAVTDPILGYGIEPLLYGHSTGLSPLAVVVAAVFWTWIWGPVGLVLAMPLTLCLVVLGRHIDALEFLDVLLGDRPALTPVESFYQRMLADDPEEALEQAELLLQDRSLTAYYDEVALGGLKLAAEDARRGLVDKAGARRIVDAMAELIGELEDHDETAPDEPVDVPEEKPLNPLAATPDTQMIAETAPPALPDAPADWATPGSVTCIAGRGILDDAVTMMLGQLLAKRGFGVRRVEHAAVARDAIEQLDLSGTRLICLSYLEIGGTPSHLRYLVRRLRRRAPHATITVGLWPEGEAALSDSEIQRVLGAHHYVSTIGEAVTQSLALAIDRKEAA